MKYKQKYYAVLVILLISLKLVQSQSIIFGYSDVFEIGDPVYEAPNIFGYSNKFAIGGPVYEVPNVYGYSLVFDMNTMGQYIYGNSELFPLNSIGAQMIVNFSVDNNHLNLDEEVLFNDLTSGESPAVAWVWDFGDGSPVSNEPDPVHKYESTGSFDVKLTVTNEAGLQESHSKSGYITVSTEADGIVLKIVETGEQNVVKWVGYQYRNEYQILKTVDDIPVQNHLAHISWDGEFLWQNDFNDEILLFGEVNGDKKQIGHIDFEYENEIEGDFKRNAILIFHNDSDMEDHFPYQPGKEEYDSKWDFYKNGEYPLSMLIPPGNEFPESFDKQPLLFVHGWGGTYSYKKNPDAIPEANEVSYWFTTVKLVNEYDEFQAWQYYYPYDTDIHTLGNCLKKGVENLKLRYPDKYIGIVTHSMGGLVTSEYITANPTDAKDNILKVLYSVPPLHGSMGANKHYKKGLGGAVEIFAGKDNEAPAPRDMSLGSNFMWELHSKEWVNLNGENSNSIMDDYFVLLGTTTKYFGAGATLHHESPDHNDGIVSISSGSLTDKGIGFATFHGNHSDGVHMQVKKRGNSKKQNIGNPLLIPEIVKAFFLQSHDDFITSVCSKPDIQVVVDGDRTIE
jgi:PKD repeat protein